MVEQDTDPASFAMRRAVAEDLPALSELNMRSKAYWGYDAEFMESCRAELTYRTSDLEEGEIWLVDGPVATVQVLPEGRTADLAKFFVDPAYIGQGLGRRTFEFALSRARALGCSVLSIESDPNAASFYESMGARLVGSTPSGSIPGRTLPTYELTLGPTDETIAATLLELAQDRGAGKTFCPSEAARALASDWRPLLPTVRRVATDIGLKATQGGGEVDPTKVQGPIRLGLPCKR